MILKCLLRSIKPQHFYGNSNVALQDIESFVRIQVDYGDSNIFDQASSISLLQKLQSK